MTLRKRTTVLPGVAIVWVLSAASLAQQQPPPLIQPGYLAPRFVAPRDAPSSIVIAAKDEPGDRLIVSGRVLDGNRPVAGVSIYVVQADASGRYSTTFPDTDLNAR